MLRIIIILKIIKMKYNNLTTENDFDKNMKKKIIKNNNNEYNKDGVELSYTKNNEINNYNINNDNDNDNDDDHVNLEIKNNLTNIDEIYNKNNNNNKNHDINQKLNNIKNVNYNFDGFDENFDGKSFLPNLNNKGINKDKNDDFSKKLNNNILLSPKRKQKTNYNILKPINILKTKNHKVPNSAFPTPNSKKSDLPSNSRISNLSKITNKLTGITSPSKITEKKLFNDTNLTNIRKAKKEEKKQRNRSLENLIADKGKNINHFIHIKEDNNIDNHYNHLYNDLKSNSKKKYTRHFGNEENCPICVALQMKNKILEEKNKMLPILTKNNFTKNKEEINKSPNKDKITKTIYPINKEKRLIRIQSGTSILTRKQ